MSRPVTLFTIQWGDLPLEEICRLGKQMGYEGLELSAAHLDMKRAATDPAYVQQVKDTLARYDLNCWAISNHLAGQCSHGIDPFCGRLQMDTTDVIGIDVITQL